MVCLRHCISVAGRTYSRDGPYFDPVWNLCDTVCGLGSVGELVGWDEGLERMSPASQQARGVVSFFAPA